MPTLFTTPQDSSPREATLADAVWGGAAVAFGILSALALGLFVLGWALIARREAARIAAQDPAAPQIIVVLPNDTVAPPHIRTRTS